MYRHLRGAGGIAELGDRRFPAGPAGPAAASAESAFWPWRPESESLRISVQNERREGFHRAGTVRDQPADVDRFSDLDRQMIWDSEPERMKPCDFDEPMTAALEARGWAGVVEVISEEGSVVLAHLLIFHSSNPNHGRRPRVMAQPAFSMTEPVRTDGAGLLHVEVPLARARPVGMRER